MPNKKATSGTGPTRDGEHPRAPHWFEFNRINDLPNEWTFEVIDWDEDPDAYGVVDRGEAEVVRGSHRFVITTWLEPRERTHERYWSIAYETTNQDGEAEPFAFHIGKSQSIARNNLGHARDVLDGDGADPHVVVREYDDGSRETFEYPTNHMAEKAADLQAELKLADDTRNYRVTVHSKEEWADQLELEQSLQTGRCHDE